MSTIVNLYGGPGTGKSTTAAMMFALLKGYGINAELVREYVKDWAWEGRKIGPYDQIYFMGKQVRREALLLGKVEVIVTDSPVLLGLMYAKKYGSDDPGLVGGISDVVLSYYAKLKRDGHTLRHVMLHRSKPYNPAGRYQTEAQARELDAEIHQLLRNSVSDDIDHLDADEDSIKGWVDDLVCGLPLVAK